MSEKGDSQEGTDVLRLKTLAEEKYTSGDIKSAIKYAKRAHRQCPNLDGVSEMLTAFKILRTSTKPATTSDGDAGPPDYYKILRVERFSHINGIKKQYKKLALTLHPDKNPFVACEEAFKLVGEAFRVLSDKIRRKEYDLKLRIAMQSAAAEEAAVEEETFWTACSTCRLLHKFNRKYLGHNLMCPNCRKSFHAVEVSENAETSVASRGIDSEDEKNNEILGTRVSARIKARKMTSVGDVLQRARGRVLRDVDEAEGGSSNRVDKSRNVGVEVDARNDGDGDGGDEIEGVRSRRGVKVRARGEDREKGGNVVDRSRLKSSKVGEEETMTLAEMQMLVKKLNKEKLSVKVNEMGMKPNLGEREKEKDTELGLREEESEIEEALESRNVKGKRERHKVSKGESLEAVGRRGSKGGDLDTKRRLVSKIVDLETMAAEASDFYEFDNDRDERRFKKGQVWAVYNDDDDRMPRNYALIDEVLSVNPFEVRLFWLDFQKNGDEALVNCKKMGFHISCGRYKVSKQALVKSLKKFSHIVDCERAARELYRVYPKKGSIWAMYDENNLNAGGRNQVVVDKQYDIAVCLTSYTEIYGLSVAYLEKVDGFRTVFNRREVGAHSIRWLGKDDIRLMSHQIPARKLSGEEVVGISKECWELDPASVPPKMLTIGLSK